MVFPGTGADRGKPEQRLSCATQSHGSVRFVLDKEMGYDPTSIFGGPTRPLWDMTRTVPAPVLSDLAHLGILSGIFGTDIALFGDPRRFFSSRASALLGSLLCTNL